MASSTVPAFRVVVSLRRITESDCAEPATSLADKVIVWSSSPLRIAEKLSRLVCCTPPPRKELTVVFPAWTSAASATEVAPAVLKPKALVAPSAAIRNFVPVVLSRVSTVPSLVARRPAADSVLFSAIAAFSAIVASATVAVAGAPTVRDSLGPPPMENSIV